MIREKPVQTNNFCKPWEWRSATSNNTSWNLTGWLWWSAISGEMSKSIASFIILWKWKQACWSNRITRVKHFKLLQVKVQVDLCHCYAQRKAANSNGLFTRQCNKLIKVLAFLEQLDGNDNRRKHMKTKKNVECWYETFMYEAYS